MNIYALAQVKPKNGETSRFIIRAETNTIARHLAARHAGSEGSEVWTNLSKTYCVRIDNTPVPDVLMRKKHGIDELHNELFTRGRQIEQLETEIASLRKDIERLLADETRN